MHTSTESIHTTISAQIQAHPVILYMKGSATFPQCGFSQQAVSILKQLQVPFHTINVLEDEQIRQGIKIFADWPTIPQLYIDGEFIGGCDIIKAMHQSGELQEKLQHHLENSQ